MGTHDWPLPNDLSQAGLNQQLRDAEDEWRAPDTEPGELLDFTVEFRVGIQARNSVDAIEIGRARMSEGYGRVTAVFDADGCSSPTPTEEAKMTYLAGFDIHTDDKLVEYWNDRDGSLSWMLAVEEALIARGYATRGPDGKPTQLTAGDTTMLAGADLPEGLMLTRCGFQAQIVDAQDVPWITFHEGGNGDPARWQQKIIELVCAALSVDPSGG